VDAYSHILGCLLGTAVGDAAGLLREGLSPRRAERIYGRTAIRPELALGRGFWSDDTEHTLMVGYALAASNGNVAEFQQCLAALLRRWLLSGPIGVGRATLRACLKLLLGFGVTRSGVASAGNGPAMRSAILGMCADSDEHLQQLVRASTRLTHTDPRAEEGALVVARAARLGVVHDSPSPAEFLAATAGETQGDELRRRLTAAARALDEGQSCAEFAAAQSWSDGVSGYVNHTVPAALYCWARSPRDVRACVESAVRLGGDADSVAAIAGAVCGANCGAGAVPKDWIAGLSEWPRSISWMEQLAQALAAKSAHQPAGAPPPMRWVATLPRNAVVAAMVIGLALRRLLPPY
jgi:ADP-ribosyl-[dinitrogen reductase] hydrolase